MPLDLHIFDVVHSSPIKVVVCVEPLSLSQKTSSGIHETIF